MFVTLTIVLNGLGADWRTRLLFKKQNNRLGSETIFSRGAVRRINFPREALRVIGSSGNFLVVRNPATIRAWMIGAAGVTT